MISMSNLPKKLPIILFGPYNMTNIIPVTTVGIANGRSIKESMKFLNGKLYLTRTHAVAVPVTILIRTIIKATMKVIFKENNA